MDEQKAEAPKASQVDLQPIVDALAPNAAEIVHKMIDGEKHQSWELERWVVVLAGLVVVIAGTVAITFALHDKPDDAAKIVIPLISFAGGLGVGSRLLKK
ncbi:hypothetical protein LGN06_29290 [Burkholderia vietnamiensis]|uniref:hypothetical protein n=1 Tax=Burkholderia vietnamiensis TaxID=60552 RepID=UPI001CF22F68|nr:hypothetical protein [Burkholderia vietnamiensis]MCA8395641.1 hypothetical protein [Burkholderia vietnamiensis]HDR8961814.1 hypothetical protein [Burkholderia vietnamiensis]HDR9247904.1 hypothetical protein [Burkholderia vietnamiensis]